ncbi:unnamed protein product [Ophioblennius macclurei]
MAALDVEDESILASIFRDSFPTLNQNLNLNQNQNLSPNPRDQPDFTAYLAELSSFGLDKLVREPERLQDERNQILQQTRDLAFCNYQTFIRTASCTRTVYRDFGTVEARVSRLLDKLPALEQKCRGFVQRAEQIGAARRMNSLTLNRHTEILEVLEIPQLMDTCVRNGYYEEALQLAAYVRRLERKHAALPVIQAMVSEVRQSSQLMLSQLLQTLRGEAALPACLRVVGFLRRMDVFTEAELRVKFLQARGAWLDALLAAVPDDDAYAHAAKTVEACRVHLFDIVTQYRAVFSDDDAAGAEARVFHGWVVQRVRDFLRSLERDLRRGVGARLDSLLGQCMYFGLSFSRVGADFRGQLARAFSAVAADTFGRALRDAADRFREDMGAYTLIAMPAALGGATVAAAATPPQAGTLQPPMALLEFPPLACFLNNVLNAFNDLRLCCPLGLVHTVSTLLQDALCTVSGELLSFYRAEQSALSSREEELFVQMCVSFSEDLLPFINRCLQLLFPHTHIAQCTGMSVSQLQKFDSFFQVNVDLVLEPLAFLLPQKETEPSPMVAPDMDIMAELGSLTLDTAGPGPGPGPGPEDQQGPGSDEGADSADQDLESPLD